MQPVLLMKFSSELVLKAIKELGEGSISAEEIANHIGCNARTVVRAVRHLETQQRLKVKRGGTGKGVKSEYQVLDAYRL